MFGDFEAAWTLPSFKPSAAWTSVAAGPALDPAVLVEALRMQQSVQSPLITAVNMTVLSNGDAVFDFGANIVGSTAFYDIIPAGAHVTLTHGEVTNPDGSVNNSFANGNVSLVAEPCPSSPRLPW